MRTTWIRLLCAVAALALGACGDGTARPVPRDGGAPPDDAQMVDPCAEAHATIGPAGGTLTLCDATLVVPGGQLEAPVEMRIERVDAVPPLPARFEIVGHAWRFSPSDFGAGMVRIELAHDSERPLELAELEGDRWVGFGACEQTPTALVQSTLSLGTYAAIVDGRELPVDPTGIGDASADVTLGDRSLRLASGTTGFLTDEASITGLRTFAMHVVEGQIALSAELAVLADGTAEPVFVRLTDAATGEQWDGGLFVNRESLRAEAEIHDDGTLDATITGTLVRESEERDVSITATGTPGPWWREPPRICFGE